MSEAREDRTAPRLRMRNGPTQLTALINRFHYQRDSGNDWASGVIAPSVSWGFMWGLAYEAMQNVLDGYAFLS